MARKSKGLAYLLWLVSIFGWLGFHRFYLGKVGTGLIWMFTGGLFGVGAAYDLITLGNQVDIYNQSEEIEDIKEVQRHAAETQTRQD